MNTFSHNEAMNSALNIIASELLDEYNTPSSKLVSQILETLLQEKIENKHRLEKRINILNADITIIHNAINTIKG